MRRQRAPIGLFLFAAACAAGCSCGEEPARDEPKGMTRAFRIEEPADLIGGPQAKGRLGDFRIENDRVRFVIEDARPSSGNGAYGGEIIAADRQRAAGEPGHSIFGEMAPAFDLRSFRPETVEVLEAGGDGQRAVVRARGGDDVFALPASMLKPSPVGVDATVDYILEPGAEALEVLVSFRSRDGGAVHIGDVQIGTLMGDGVPIVFDQKGFNWESPTPTEFEWVAAAGPFSPISYGLLAPGRPIALVYKQVSMRVFSLGPAAAEAGLAATARYWVAVGERDVADLLRIRESLPRPPGRPRLRVSATHGGAPVEDVRIHVTQGDLYRAFARTRADGTVEIPLPAGDYSLRAVADGRVALAEVSATVTAEGGQVALALGPSGTLHAQVSEAGTAIPAKLIIVPETPRPTFPTFFGEPVWPASSSAVVFLAPGGQDVSLPPGRYTITAQRGFEYSLDTQVLDLGAETVSARFELTRLVDTAGWLCGDFHIHAAPSADADDSIELKLLAMAAEGLEVPVPTDHDVIADYGPHIEGLGLAPFLKTLVGEEVTTAHLGHFNAFPLQVLDAPNGGAVQWLFRTETEITDDLRSNPARPLVQVNHPRGFDPGSGNFLDVVGFDHHTFTTTRGRVEGIFDVIEVMNGPTPDHSELTQRDWFAFLSRGYRMPGTGNSDSHRCATSEVGTPRNYVHVGVDSVGEVDPAAFVQAVREARLTISGGPFVTLIVNGRPVGELAALDASGEAAVHVRVQAPPWMGPIETLQIIRGGTVVRTISLTQHAQVVRYDGVWRDTSPGAADTFYVVRVKSRSGNLGPAAPSERPYAITNAVYLDADGNGLYDPTP